MQKFHDCSIATRFSWASERQTTLIEDRAYSLLGLFDINIPLIYGEGDRAFLRLQWEPIRKYDDATFLLWMADRDNNDDAVPRQLGALAPSLSYFQRQECDDSVPFHGPSNLSISARGVHLDVSLKILKTDLSSHDESLGAGTLCYALIVPHAHSGGIFLIKTLDNFQRVGHLSTWDTQDTLEWVDVGRQSIIIEEGRDLDLEVSFTRLKCPPGFEARESYYAPSSGSAESPEDKRSSPFELYLEDMGYRLHCRVTGRQAGEHFLVSGMDHYWRVVMQNASGEQFVLFLVNRFNSPHTQSSRISATGLEDRKVLDWDRLPQTGIRPSAAKRHHDVRLSYIGMDLWGHDVAKDLKQKLIGEACSIGCIPVREYDIILVASKDER